MNNAKIDFDESASKNVESESNFLTFGKISGVGVIKCHDCNYSEEICVFSHGMTKAYIGRQCPLCGTFCEELNESEAYHQFGKPKEDFVCPNCNYTIRRKEESIFKGNDVPLFCPKCSSKNLSYLCKYLTALLLFITSFCVSAQKIYAVDHKYIADIKVYVTDKEYLADLIVFKTDREYNANLKDNKGIWYFTDKQYNADKKIYFVDREYLSDLVICFTNKEYRAGWQKNGKKHLLY